ncbi:hypothetical protein UO65_3263 [Actinokineospora spheciospongiae]|uniref:Uncharacterized protein n=1 Tax=Actinokineospora spheciospongiae TaxID=909613 RepID=W7IKL2_9PSEU|nr:hypothetical protein UO65_3263 [Actinokineospora spheciospongiae]
MPLAAHRGTDGPAGRGGVHLRRADQAKQTAHASRAPLVSSRGKPPGGEPGGQAASPGQLRRGGGSSAETPVCRAGLRAGDKVVPAPKCDRHPLTPRRVWPRSLG